MRTRRSQKAARLARITACALGVAALALVARPVSQAQACQPIWWAPVLVTNVRVPVPPTFALTAMLTSDFRHERFRDRPWGEPALTRRGERVAMRVEEIGAGVARLQPERELGPGLWRVEGLLSPDSIRVVRGIALPPPPPIPARVELDMPFIRSMHLPAGTRVRGVNAFFPDGVPRSEVLLGYWDGELRGAARVRAHDERVTLYRPGSECAPLPPGVGAPQPNAHRALAWMDGWGRISERADH